MGIILRLGTAISCRVPILSNSAGVHSCCSEAINNLGASAVLPSVSSPIEITNCALAGCASHDASSVWCITGTPLCAGNAHSLFSHPGLPLWGVGIMRANHVTFRKHSETDRCLAIGSHRQWGYAPGSKVHERKLHKHNNASCQALFVGEQRWGKLHRGNYHTTPPPTSTPAWLFTNPPNPLATCPHSQLRFLSRCLLYVVQK